MLKFKYEMSQDLIMLLGSTIRDYNGSQYLTCYMPEEYAKKLRYQSLWLVCTFDKQDGRKDIYTDPLGIVAPSNSDSLRIYTEITGDIHDIILEELQRDCKNLKVIPYED